MRFADSYILKLAHDYLVPDNVRETIAGLSVPTQYAPWVLSALLLMSAILIGGCGAAFNMARSQVDRLEEEYGWPLLYSGGREYWYNHIGIWSDPRHCGTSSACIRDVQSIRKCYRKF
jgi:hypothetical protein